MHILFDAIRPKCKNIHRGLVAAPRQASGLKSERNSYCVSDYPVISQNTSLHFNRLSPFASPWEVLESGVGWGDGGGLFVVRHYGTISDLISTVWPRTMGSTQACERPASQFMYEKSPLFVISPRNLQSVYSHSSGIINFCTSCSIHLCCIH